MRAELFENFTIIGSLPPLNMEDHITDGHQCLQTHMTPSAPQAQVVPPAYIVYNLPQQTAPPTLAEKNNPAERWDLQVMELCRLINVPDIENVSGICHTLAPLTKEKSRSLLEIGRRASAHTFR